jgi:hypothetical protein
MTASFSASSRSMTIGLHLSKEFETKRRQTRGETAPEQASVIF